MKTLRNFIIFHFAGAFGCFILSRFAKPEHEAMIVGIIGIGLMWAGFCLLAFYEALKEIKKER